MSDVRTRIAPSPTGQDLHIGNVYTALLNYVYAKKHNGSFIIRIEDTDRVRLVDGSENRILASLRWLGLKYAEGPDIGGPYAPYRQSERKSIYKTYAEQLVESGHAFYCFCSAERLTKIREQQQKEKKPSLYDGTCKAIPVSEAKKRAQTEPSVIRMSMPDDGVTSFNDLIRGEISFENRHLDDQVILKSDGYPTYHLGVVVDDYLMKVSHVIRAEEWISSTPKHVLLYRWFGWNMPVFAHGPILRNPDKSKLSKRKNPVWASWYREQGYLPEAILNYLALMGWSMPDEKEIFSLEEMISHFDLKDIRPAGPAFDLKKLDWMNGEYIRKLDVKSLQSKVVEFIGNDYPEDLIEKTIPLVRERIKKLSDYLPLAAFFFRRPKDYEVELVGKKELFGKMCKMLEKADTWKADVIGERLMDLSKEVGIKTGEFFMLLRVAITGKKISPPLNESMEILGKEEVLTRLANVQ